MTKIYYKIFWNTRLIHGDQSKLQTSQGCPNRYEHARAMVGLADA